MQVKLLKYQVKLQERNNGDSSSHCHCTAICSSNWGTERRTRWSPPALDQIASATAGPSGWTETTPLARETMRECKTFGGNPDPLSVPNQFMFSAKSRTLVLAIHMVQVRLLYQYSSLLDPPSMLFHIQVKNLSHIFYSLQVHL